MKYFELLEHVNFLQFSHFVPTLLNNFYSNTMCYVFVQQRHKKLGFLLYFN